MRKRGLALFTVLILLIPLLLIPAAVSSGSACEHQWTLVKTVPATCTESGKNSWKCSLCGKKRNETIPALGHDWAYCMIVRKPTCTEDGLKRCVCSRNPEHVEEEILPAAGHRWGRWVTVRRPAPTERGIRRRTCEKCGETTSLGISPLVAVWALSAQQSVLGFLRSGSGAQ